MASLSSLQLELKKGKLLDVSGNEHFGEVVIKFPREVFKAELEKFGYILKDGYPSFWLTRPAIIKIDSTEIPSEITAGILIYKLDGNEIHSSLISECSDFNDFIEQKALLNSFGDEEVVSNYLLSGELILVFDVIKKFVKSGRKENLNILLTGLPGSGKSSFAFFVKDMLNLEFASSNIPDAHEASDLFYYRGFSKEGDLLRKSELAKLLEEKTDTPVVILLDELNRGQVGVTNSIFNMLDFQRKIVLLNEVIQIDRPVIFVGTANLGSKFAVGQIDSALVQRFNIVVNMQPLGKDSFVKIATETVAKLNLKITEEKIDLLADLLVACSSILSEDELLDFTEVSPRTLNNVLNLMSYGVSFSNAVLVGLANQQITSENRQLILDLPQFRKIAAIKD